MKYSGLHCSVSSTGLEHVNSSDVVIGSSPIRSAKIYFDCDPSGRKFESRRALLVRRNKSQYKIDFTGR